MPRSVQDVLDHADELARRFETYEPVANDERDAQVFAALRDAAISRSTAEQSIKTAVDKARAHGYSWHSSALVNDRENSPVAIVRIPHLRRGG